MSTPIAPARAPAPAIVFADPQAGGSYRRDPVTGALSPTSPDDVQPKPIFNPQIQE
jgi:hypothetical protein